MESNVVINRVSLWFQNYPGLSKWFKKIDSLVKLAAIVSEKYPDQSKNFSDLVDGFVAIGVGKDEEADRLLEEGWYLILEFVQSESYQRAVIKSEITGEEFIKVDKIHIPITEQSLFNFLKKQKGQVFGRNDLKQLVRDFKIDRVDLHQPASNDDSSPGTTDPKNNSTEGKVTKNRFNSMSIEDVRIFFEVLVKKRNNSGKIWMSESGFEIFVRRSFGKEDLKKPKINLGSRDKMAVVRLFWLFYDRCQNLDLQENRKKIPFLELLKDAFDTNEFEALRSDNFKLDKSKYVWE